MRARALSRLASALAPSAARQTAPRGRGLRRPQRGALVFLRGRDVDARLRGLEAVRRAARPLLGDLACALVERSLHEKLGYRTLGDYGRERLGVGARSVREWARVWRGLAELPLLRAALLSGEISWSVARLVVGLATPETEAACLATVRGRTLRAVEAIVRAVKQAERAPPERHEAEDEEAERERVAVRLRCTRREETLWHAALELARREAGQWLPAWRCAELVAAEAASALGAPEALPEQPDPERRPPRREEPEPCGLREQAFPGLRWRAVVSGLPEELAALAQGVAECPAREIDRRLRAAIAFLQGVDFEQGRLLRQLRDRRLFAELGFASLDEYVRERLDTSPRTARRLVALARAGHRAPAVASAFRKGELHAGQAHALARVADVESAQRWAKRARQVSFRRLEEEVEAEAPLEFWAPQSVAGFFLVMLRRAGSLERLLAHAIREWVQRGEQFRDYADFERDGYRCTVPGCTQRRNLQSHHIRFLGRGGPDEAWNRTTLCAWHHLRALHELGSSRIAGCAPGALVFELGSGERFASGDVRIAG